MLHSDKEHFRELVSLFATTLDAVLHKSNPHQVCVHACAHDVCSCATGPVAVGPGQGEDRIKCEGEGAVLQCTAVRPSCAGQVQRGNQQ